MFGGEVYIAQCIATKKSYIGITTKGYRNRWKRHVQDAASGSQTALHRAIRKHGENGFQLAVLMKPESIERLKQAEVWTIEHLKTMAPNGYNLTRGGDGVIGGIFPESWYAAVRAAAERRRGVKRLPEVIAKMSAAQRGRKRPTISEETRKRMSEAQKGRKMAPEAIARTAEKLRGKKLSAEHCAKLSDAHKGIHLSQEARDKLSVHWKGRTFTKEHRAKLSASQKGRILSPEHLEKLRAAQKARRERERVAKEQE